MSTPRVTVVVTAFQQKRWAAEAAISARSQTLSDVEVVVVDDGSTDGTGEALTALGFRVIRQANAGVCAARNTGMAAAQGDLVVFLDGDDRLLPDACAHGFRLLRTTGARFAFGRSRLIDAEGRPLRAHGVRRRVDGDLYENLLREPWVAPPASMIVHRETLVALGGWNPDLRHGGDDYDVYLRLARSHLGTDSETLVCDYRLHGGNRSTHYRACLADNLRVLGEQRRHTAGSERHEQARQAGIRHYQRTYGAKIALSELMRPAHGGGGLLGRLGAAGSFAARHPVPVLRLVHGRLRRTR